MATKAAIESEILEFCDATLLKWKRDCLEEVCQLEQGVEMHNMIFRGAFSLGTEAFRQHKHAAAALLSTKEAGHRSAVIEVLVLAQQISEADLKCVTTWCAVAKSGLQSLEKKLEDTVDKVTAVDIEIAMTDGAGDAVEISDTQIADLDAVLEFLA
jgi:hypothetical protein